MTERIRTGPIDDPASFLEAASAAVNGPTLDARLSAVASLHEWLPLVERDAVEVAIARGATWAQVARALGVSRQAVHRKHAQLGDSKNGSRRAQVVAARAFDRWARDYLDRAARADDEKRA